MLVFDRRMVLWGPARKERSCDMGPEASTPITVGRYTIHRPLAAGGMATVHLGRLLGRGGCAHRRHRDSSPVLDDPDFVAMLVDEAGSARIQHPNVVQTLDVVAAPGDSCSSMEYDARAVLLDSLRDMPRAMHDPLPIVSAVITGMLHLHTRRTKRPATRASRSASCIATCPLQNVVVGVDGVARVLDFGVAKASNRLQSTRFRTDRGKLAHVPGQLRAKPSTRLIDVYAAGVVLWETLTRKRLFSARTRLAHRPRPGGTSSLRRARSRPHCRRARRDRPGSSQKSPAIDIPPPATPHERSGPWCARAHVRWASGSRWSRRAPFAIGRGYVEGAREKPGSRPAACPRRPHRPSPSKSARAPSNGRSIEAHARVAFRARPACRHAAITPVSMGGVLPAPTPKSRTGGSPSRWPAPYSAGPVGAVIFALAVRRPAPRALAQSATSPAADPAVAGAERSGAPVPETSLEPPPSARCLRPSRPVSPAPPYRPSLRGAKPEPSRRRGPGAARPSASSGEDMYQGGAGETYVFSSSCSRPAATAAGAGEARERGGSLFDEGLTALDAGKFDEACAKLEASHKGRAAPGTLLALPETARPKPAAPRAQLRTFKEASEFARRIGDAKRAQAAMDRALALGPRVSYLKSMSLPRTQR